MGDNIIPRQNEPQPGDPTPEQRAAAREAWPDDREQIVHYTRRIQESLEQLDRFAGSDPDGYRSGSPAVMARLEARNIIEDAGKLLAWLLDSAR